MTFFRTGMCFVISMHKPLENLPMLPVVKLFVVKIEMHGIINISVISSRFNDFIFGRNVFLELAVIKVKCSRLWMIGFGIKGEVLRYEMFLNFVDFYFLCEILITSFKGSHTEAKWKNRASFTTLLFPLLLHYFYLSF